MHESIQHAGARLLGCNFISPTIGFHIEVWIRAIAVSLYERRLVTLELTCRKDARGMYVCTPVRIKLSHSWRHKFSATLRLSFRKQLPTFRRTVVSCLLGWNSLRTHLTTFREGITHIRNAGNYFHQSAWQNSLNDSIFTDTAVRTSNFAFIS